MSARPTGRFISIFYCVWAALSIGLAIALAGPTAETATRLLVLAFLAGQILMRSSLVKTFPQVKPKRRFVLMGTLLASVVEGFHVISTPVFASLRVDRHTPLARGLANYGLDLLFTVPAYLVIFSLIWYFIDRYAMGLWHYILIMGVGQALGDGGVFFFASAPFMLVFLPYPMSNYHALNIIPFLAVQNQLRAERTPSRKIYLALPALIGVYLVCGATIKIMGRLFGLEPGP